MEKTVINDTEVPLVLVCRSRVISVTSCIKPFKKCKTTRASCAEDLSVLEALPVMVLNCTVMLFSVGDLAEPSPVLDTLLTTVLFRMSGVVHPAPSTVANTTSIIIAPSACFFICVIFAFEVMSYLNVVFYCRVDVHVQ